MLKRTPLYEAHRRAGGRLIEFGGWEMPVQYTSIVDEHQAVRSAAGLFDICHMGEVMVSGPSASPLLNTVLTNDISKLQVGQGQYTLMCNPSGGVIDDLYAYRLEDEKYLLIINASRIDPDVEWLKQQFDRFGATDGTQLQNVSEEMGAVAVQGPKVIDFIDRCFSGASIAGTKVGKPTELKKNQIAGFSWNNQVIWVARTGYTGEDGFELVGPSVMMEQLWNHLLSVGQPSGLKPAGLGARDTLRTEVCYPLYGHELDEQTSPIEAGVGFFVALEKPDFIGKAALAQQKSQGVKKRCVAFKMTDKSAPPRPHYPIWASNGQDLKIGEVVSGTQSPSLGIGIGLGYVPAEFSKPGTPIQIEIRGKKAAAVVVGKPIYKKAV